MRSWRVRSVGASLLMPGAVATRIFSDVEPDQAIPANSRISPERAAEIAFARRRIGPVEDPDLIRRSARPARGSVSSDASWK